MLGSIAAMYIGRYLLRNWVSKKAEKFKVFGAIDQAMEKEVCIDIEALKYRTFG